MTTLEDLLRNQLHAAADPVEVPLDDQGVLAAGRRARRARTLRWVLLVLVLVVAVVVASLSLGQLGGEPDRRAVPDPLQAPTAEVSTENPVVVDFSGEGRPGKVRIEPIEGGLRFIPLDGDSRHPVDVAVDAQLANTPFPGWIIATLPPGTVWAQFVAPDDVLRGRQVGMSEGVRQVPGTDRVAYVAAMPAADESWPGEYRLIRGSADGRAFDTSFGREVITEQLPTLHGNDATWFVDDELAVAGVANPLFEWNVKTHPTRPGHLPGVAIAAENTDEAEFMVVLPEGVDAADVTWSFPIYVTEEPTTILGPFTRELPDGRTMLVQAFRASTLLHNDFPQVSITYTAEDGARVTVPVS